MANSFYSSEELVTLGLKAFGENCRISRKASFYGAEQMTLGDNIRIDDFCILSGSITLGSNIHIAAFSALYGGEEGIFMEDNTGVSTRSTIYTEIDDFTSSQLIGSIHPIEKRNLIRGKVILRSYSQVGAHCVILPQTIINEGAVVGACSLVNRDLEPWGVYYGTPARFQRKRIGR